MPDPSAQPDAPLPNVAAFTSAPAPLRHRVRVELEAPVPDVWALVGDHGRLPEYSAGITSVELDEPETARTRVCRFRSPNGASPGPILGETIRWEAENLGYATSAEPDNVFGLSNSLSLVTVRRSSTGTILTWEEYYDSADLPAARASFDDGIADIAEQLMAGFGGRIVERFMDGERS